MKCMALSAIVVTPIISEDAMEAFTVVGLTSIGCVAFIGMIYAELLLLGRG